MSDLETVFLPPVEQDLVVQSVVLWSLSAAHESLVDIHRFSFAK